MSWAYQSYEEHIDGSIWLDERREWVNGNIVMLPKMKVKSDLAPRIIDNVPTVGFTITGSVGRVSTSNKLWRVLDPRGFELEISTSCFEDLILNGDILLGVIQNPCIWYSGKQLKYVKETV